MDELNFDDKKYLSSKRAAEITGYAKDYVGQLCREGRVEARLVGRAWYVSEDSIREHRFGEETKTEQPEVKIPVGEEDPRVLQKKEVATNWGTSHYAPESVSVVPTLTERTSVDVFSERIEAPVSSVHHMQAVWQDWFTAKKEARLEEEDASTEVTLTRIPEEELSFEEEIEEDTVVPLYRLPMQEQELEEEEPSYREENFERVPEVRKVPRREVSHASGGSSFVTRALIVGVTLIVLSVTLIALGYGQDVLQIGDNFVLEYLSGVSK